MPSSETDPLLPKGNTAPEISGYGFSKKPNSIRSEVIDDVEDIEDKSFELVNHTERGLSTLRILSALSAITVGLAILITLLVSGTWDALRDSLQGTPRDVDSNIQARVDKILERNPLIGP